MLELARPWPPVPPILIISSHASCPARDRPPASLKMMDSVAIGIRMQNQELILVTGATGFLGVQLVRE
ncbi:MAG: hypothetical protein WBX18_13560, partial [Terracidiphilus sp.]